MKKHNLDKLVMRDLTYYRLPISVWVDNLAARDIEYVVKKQIQHIDDRLAIRLWRSQFEH